MGRKPAVVDVDVSANGSPRVAAGMPDQADSGTPKARPPRGLQKMMSFNPFKRAQDFGFNPELVAKEKREWSRHFSDNKVVDWPPNIFENFIIVGLPETADVSGACEPAPAKASSRHHVPKQASSTPRHSKGVRVEEKQPLLNPEEDYRGYDGIPAEVLYSYPAGRTPELGHVGLYCFPHGVLPRLVKRTPSLTALNQFFCGQQYSSAETSSFIFYAKAGDNLPLYGVCCYMEEAVQQPPWLLNTGPRAPLPLTHTIPVAPRCYCLLTHYPFFTLHFKVLHMIMGLEHMQSTNSFLQASMGAPSPGPSAFAPAAARPEPESRRQDRAQPDQAYRERRASHAAAGPSHSLPDSLGSSLARRAPAQPPPPPTERSRPPGLPLHHTTGGMHQPPAEPGTSHPGADPGRIPPAGEASPSKGQPQHRKSRSLGEGPDAAHLAARGPDARRMVTLASKRLQAALDTQPGHRRGSRESGGGSRDWDPEGAGSDSDATSFVTAGSHLEPEAGMATLPSYQALSGFGDPTGLDGSLQHSPLAAAQGSTNSSPHHPHKALRTISLREAAGHTEMDGSPDEVDSSAEALQVLQRYHQVHIPAPGSELEFWPGPDLQPMHYTRRVFHIDKARVHRTAVAEAEAEASDSLCEWTVATLAGILSLEDIITVLTCALLERQLVFFSPRIGLLTTAVLAMIPMLRPFAWQSMLMPVLPAHDSMLHLLAAPVPFILGMQFKTAEVASRSSGLVRVNLYKEEVANTGRLPTIPGHAALLAKLSTPYHALRRGCEKSRGKAIYALPAAQLAAAAEFLQVLHSHLEGLCADIGKHICTDVQTSERVSVLMKETFVASREAPKDREFMKEFVDTQMFTVYSDCIIK